MNQADYISTAALLRQFKNRCPMGKAQRAEVRRLIELYEGLVKSEQKSKD